MDQDIFKDVSTICIKFLLVPFLYLCCCSGLFFFCLEGVISPITEGKSFADCPPVLKIKGAWLADHKAGGKWHFWVTAALLSSHNFLLVVSKLVQVSWPTEVCVAPRKYLKFLDWSELVLAHLFTLSLHVAVPRKWWKEATKIYKSPLLSKVSAL